MELENRGIPTPGGSDKWQFSTVKFMLKNEKFMGDLLLQKSFTEDFLTKKNVKNEGQFPQYYVQNAHPPIVPKEVFQRVQGKLIDQERSRTSSRLSNHNAIFGKIFCGECGSPYRRYAAGKKEVTKWRCKERVSKLHACGGRAVTEEEVLDSIVQAFNAFPDKRDEIIRMQERVLWGPLDRIGRELDAIDERKNELEGVISDYAETGHLDRRILFIYSDDDAEIDEETAVERISEELDGLEEKRTELLIQKGDLGIKEANLHTLLKLVDQMIAGEGGGDSDNAEHAAETDGSGETERVEDTPACYSLADFYERTDDIDQWGEVKEYDNDLMKRFVEKIVVKEDSLEVKFKAGIGIEVKTEE